MLTNQTSCPLEGARRINGPQIRRRVPAHFRSLCPEAADRRSHGGDSWRSRVRDPGVHAGAGSASAPGAAAQAVKPAPKRADVEAVPRAERFVRLAATLELLDDLNPFFTTSPHRTPLVRRSGSSCGGADQPAPGRTLTKLRRLPWPRCRPHLARTIGRRTLRCRLSWRRSRRDPGGDDPAKVLIEHSRGRTSLRAVSTGGTSLWSGERCGDAHGVLLTRSVVARRAYLSRSPGLSAGGALSTGRPCARDRASGLVGETKSTLLVEQNLALEKNDYVAAMRLCALSTNMIALISK